MPEKRKLDEDKSEENHSMSVKRSKTSLPGPKVDDGVLKNRERDSILIPELALRSATASDCDQIIELIVGILEEYDIHGSNVRRRQHLKDLKSETFKKVYNLSVPTESTKNNKEDNEVMIVETERSSECSATASSVTRPTTNSKFVVIVDTTHADAAEQQEGMNRSEKIVATCSLKHTKPNSPLVRLERLYCHREYRKQGIGRYLLQWAIDTATTDGRSMIELIVDKKHQEALNLYRKFGFVEWVPNGKSDNDVFMRLKL